MADTIRDVRGNTVGPSAHKFNVAIRFTYNYTDKKDSRCSTINISYRDLVEMRKSTTSVAKGDISTNFTVSWAGSGQALPPSAYTASDSSTYYAYGSTTTSLKTKWTGGTLTITKARSCYYNYSTTGQYKSTIAANTDVNFKRYTYTLNANGGTFSNGASTLSTYKFYGMKYVFPATANDASYSVAAVPTRDGYTFLGWSTSSTATSSTLLPGNSIDGSNGNTTYYAVWELNGTTCTIPVYLGNGIIDSSTYTQMYGESCIELQSLLSTVISAYNSDTEKPDKSTYISKIILKSTSSEETLIEVVSGEIIVKQTCSVWDNSVWTLATNSITLDAKIETYTCTITEITFNTAGNLITTNKIVPINITENIGNPNSLTLIENNIFESTENWTQVLIEDLPKKLTSKYFYETDISQADNLITRYPQLELLPNSTVYLLNILKRKNFPESKFVRSGYFTTTTRFDEIQDAINIILFDEDSANINPTGKTLYSFYLFDMGYTDTTTINNLGHTSSVLGLLTLDDFTPYNPLVYLNGIAINDVTMFFDDTILGIVAISDVESYAATNIIELKNEALVNDYKKELPYFNHILTIDPKFILVDINSSITGMTIGGESTPEDFKGVWFKAPVVVGNSSLIPQYSDIYISNNKQPCTYFIGEPLSIIDEHVDGEIVLLELSQGDIIKCGKYTSIGKTYFSVSSFDELNNDNVTNYYVLVRTELDMPVLKLLKTISSTKITYYK